MNGKSLIRELAKCALAKKGSQQNSTWRDFDALEDPHIELSGLSWRGLFFEVINDGNERLAQLPVLATALDEYRTQYAAIRASSRHPVDNHVYLEVPLDGRVPVETMKTLIDAAYEIVWNKLDDDAKLKIELACLPYDENSLIDRLIELHGLQDSRNEIYQLSRRALLLRTKKTSEAKIPACSTKIGGRPDLPEGAEWPAFADGKPLAFLAQFDLSEIARIGAPIQGFPELGHLTFFSAWGWLDEESGEPLTPDDSGVEQLGWTAILHVQPGSILARRKAPPGTNSFEPASVQTIPILSFPNHRAEPPLAAMTWSDDKYDRFDAMQSDFRSIQMGHLLGNGDSLASCHQLGGYAIFQQQYPEELHGSQRAMLLQIGTDGKLGMEWGDGGELTFYADAKGLSMGRFEQIWGTCQGG